MDPPSNMRYFPKIPPNSLKISPNVRANNQSQSPTDLHIFIKTKLFHLHLQEKMWENMEKRLFFRAALAGLGKYRMGGYGRIGVYRVKEGDREGVTYRG